MTETERAWIVVTTALAGHAFWIFKPVFAIARRRFLGGKMLDVKGNIGSSGISDEIQVDASLNVNLSVGYTVASGSFQGAAVAMQAKFPIAAVMDALAASTKNGTVVLVEGWAKQALEAYMATQAAPAVAPEVKA